MWGRKGSCFGLEYIRELFNINITIKKTLQISILFLTTLTISGCSWSHLFIIKNNTDQDWKIEYKINDNRGVFKNKITIKNGKRDTVAILNFSDGMVNFILKPRQLAIIGHARNTTYKRYKSELKVDPDMYWRPFVNIDSLVLSSKNILIAKSGNDLSDLLSKNKYEKAEVKLSKILE